MDKESSYSILKLMVSIVTSIALRISSDDTYTTRSIDFVHYHIESEPTNEDLIIKELINKITKEFKPY
ncbi:hypothetical protein H8356DRAFT_1351991 [Neocallimastix lanati (nom. inval.)]|nr:hypothetical protein H8356DRAFT_1351991 [Neocallimastix sp. JGI-2020a]